MLIYFTKCAVILCFMSKLVYIPHYIQWQIQGVPSLAWPEPFSPFVWRQGKKGLVNFHRQFCPTDQQILSIFDWPLIGVDRVQRGDNDELNL